MALTNGRIDKGRCTVTSNSVTFMNVSVDMVLWFYSKTYSEVPNSSIVLNKGVDLKILSKQINA